MASTMRKAKALWAAWVRLARMLGNFEARILLTVLYAVFLPFGLCVRLFTDPLRRRKRPTSWLDAPPQSVGMSSAHKQ
jgi:hypothetical protein